MTRATKSFVAILAPGGIRHAVTEVGTSVPNEGPVWAQTACGLVANVPQAGHIIHPKVEPYYVPTCKTCLKVIA